MSQHRYDYNVDQIGGDFSVELAEGQHLYENADEGDYSTSSEESAFEPGEDEYVSIDEDEDESPQDVSDLLTHLNQMETKIITQKAAKGEMNSASTQQVLRQLSQLKVDLLTPSQKNSSIGKKSRNRSSSRGRSVSSRGGSRPNSRPSSRAASPGGSLGSVGSGIVIMDPAYAPTLDDDVRSMGSMSAGRRAPGRTSSASRRGRKNAILEDDALRNSNHSIYSRGDPRRGDSMSNSEDDTRLVRVNSTGEIVESAPEVQQQDELKRSWHGLTPQSAGSLGRPRLGRPGHHNRYEPRSAGSLHKPSIGRRSNAPEPPFPMLGASVDVHYNDDDSLAGGSGVYSRGGMPRGSSHSVYSNDNKPIISAAREDRRQQAFEDKLAENGGYYPDLDKQPRSGPIRKSTAIWNIICNLITFPIADACICKEGPGAKKAWREKFTIFLIFLIASGAFVATVTVIPLFVCVSVCLLQCKFRPFMI